MAPFDEITMPDVWGSAEEPYLELTTTEPSDLRYRITFEGAMFRCVFR